MSPLPKIHPNTYREFVAGHFTVQKIKRVFSAMDFDQAHEQKGW